MPTGASSLSIIASGIYALVVLTALVAARTASASGQQPWHYRTWLMLAFLFAALALARWFEVEDVVRSSIRDHLRSEGSYAGRRTLQTAVAVLVAILTAAAGIWWFLARARSIEGRRNIAVTAAAIAGFGMIFLVLIRLVSLHFIDWFLYGPLKLNWFADLGLSLVVAGAAIQYSRIVASRT